MTRPADEPMYGCHDCQDTGLVLEERVARRTGYLALYGTACHACTYGQELIASEARRRAEATEKPSRATRPANQRHTP